MESKNIIEIGCYCLWTIILLIIVYLNFKGKVHFGWGLGDIIISAFIIIIVILVDGALFMKTNNPIGRNFEIFIHSVAILFLVYILLKMTILRGGESPWDGQIFFK